LVPAAKIILSIGTVMGLAWNNIELLQLATVASGIFTVILPAADVDILTTNATTLLRDGNGSANIA
jgi:hypothetical protein